MKNSLIFRSPMSIHSDYLTTSRTTATTKASISGAGLGQSAITTIAGGIAKV